MTNILTEIKNSQKSIFVSANAGSGKTYILVARVLALLLNGENPLKILCISFTEAAAGEMRERIQKRLKEWSERQDFSDDDLLQNEPEEKILKAKNLYKEIVLLNKMPKIITFHGFCMKVIKSFSSEIGMLYKPSILTSAHQAIMQKDLFRKLFLQKEASHAINQLKFYFSNYTLQEKIIPDILRKLSSNFNFAESINAVFEHLSLKYDSKNLNEIIFELEQNFIFNLNFQDLKNFVNQINSLSQKTQQQEKSLILFERFFKEKKLNLLTDALLTKSKTPFKKGFISADLKKTFPESEYFYEKICENFEALFEFKSRIITAKLTEYILFLTQSILKNYQQNKENLNVLDFDDLIKITKQALLGSEKDFLLFKLDGGINHILVDEAQDTNFLQWEILDSILEEFFAGFGTERRAKSLFIVGDKKQCIFGFQASEPEALDAVLEKYKKNLTVLQMKQSRRTSQGILDFVDRVFAPYFNSKHTSALSENFARIEILKPCEVDLKKENSTSNFWQMPWEDGDDEACLKEKIANQITSKILEILNEGRGVKPCDFMLLIRFRDAKLFDFLKKELKKHNIGVSFGDKIKLSESFALLDFIALLGFLLNPKQTSMLAAVLKSPMFGFGEAEFENIFIFKNAEIPKEINHLKAFLNNSVESFFTECFAIFRFNYNEREIKEISYIWNLIEEFNQNSKNSTLQGFFDFFQTLLKLEEEMKLEFPEDESAVKINTVHGAKGLESKIVFILNATEVFGSQANKEYFAFQKQENFFLISKNSIKCAKWQKIMEENKKSSYEEYLRLLYVALTRAKEEVYIFPKKLSKEEEYESWYSILQKATSDGKIQIGKPSVKFATDSKTIKKKINIPDFIPIESKKTNFIKPTKSLQESKNLQIGSFFHFVLQMRNPQLEIEFFIKTFHLLEKHEIEEHFAKAIKVKNSFPFLFLENSFSEVEIMNPLENGDFFVGRVDKIIIKENEIWIVDFKYQKNIELFDKFLSQIESYKHIIEKIYQNKKVRCFFLWIKNEEFEEVIPSSQKDGNFQLLI